MEKTTAKLSKDQKKLDKQAKKAKTMEKFMNKPKITNTSDKKVNVKIASEDKIEINTPLGEKKNVDIELLKSYCPLYTEEGWFNWWEKQGYFKPEYNENKSDEKFVIMIPPPNVTGILHIGHALTCSIEDTIVRWNRMHGKQTLWLPGTDHAGIATQTVIEKKLLRERNLTRHDLGREEFVKEIFKWKNEKGNTIINQLRQLGSSCDFDRLRFTMDDSMSKAVTETFVRLFDEKLIYRSNRLVNWSCSLRSAISDIEVDKVDITKRTYLSVPNYEKQIEFGCMVHFAYEVADSKEKIYVATTRIETMLGDTGLAVHPEDPRYTHLHGKFVTHPFVASRVIPIVCDSFVDQNFGTGAVKITPAHDHNDYVVGKKHDLEFINILTDDGLIVAGYGEFSGMKRFDARKAIIERLDGLGLYEKTTDNSMVIPVCSKSKDIIEPMIKNQWYLRCKDMAKEALRVVQTGELKLLPKDVHNGTWARWMEDCHDWCISRQLWWGHQIPVYQIGRKSECDIDTSDGDTANWVAARSHEEALELASLKLGLDKSEVYATQDQDVLDTWFSSQLFPFSTMGWPDNTGDLQKYFPGHLLETGHDIIFFWVARMVMIGLKLTGKLPFETVYLHAMIRDAHGRKMSKSLGNVLNPYDVINGISLPELQAALEKGNLDPKELKKARESQAKDFPDGIPQCGTDALRFSLLAYTSQARDINLDVLRVKGYRNFCNKIWQAFRYCQMLGLSRSLQPVELTTLRGSMSATDMWILSRLGHAVEEMHNAFVNHNFSLATTIIYQFWLYELCDVYIEYTKPLRNSTRQSVILQVLYECVEVGLRLLHPMMPFITEELFQRLPRRQSQMSEKIEDSIMVTAYPKSDDYRVWVDRKLEKNFELANEITRKVRSYRKEANMTDKQVFNVTCVSVDIEFCDNFLRDIILPLSNSVMSSQPASAVVVSNDKVEICVAETAVATPGTAASGIKINNEELLFHIRTSEEEKKRSLEKLKLFNATDGALTGLSYVLVKQYCNWVNGQAARGKSAIKETLDFVNEHLLRYNYLGGSKYPTLADSVMLNYLAENKVNEALVERYPNLQRWRTTLMNYE